MACVQIYAIPHLGNILSYNNHSTSHPIIDVILDSIRPHPSLTRHPVQNMNAVHTGSWGTDTDWPSLSIHPSHGCPWYWWREVIVEDVYRSRKWRGWNMSLTRLISLASCCHLTLLSPSLRPSLALFVCIGFLTQFASTHRRVRTTQPVPPVMLAEWLYVITFFLLFFLKALCGVKNIFVSCLSWIKPLSLQLSNILVFVYQPENYVE